MVRAILRAVAVAFSVMKASASGNGTRIVATVPVRCQPLTGAARVAPPRLPRSACAGMALQPAREPLAVVLQRLLVEVVHAGIAAAHAAVGGQRWFRWNRPRVVVGGLRVAQCTPSTAGWRRCCQSRAVPATRVSGTGAAWSA